MSLELLLRYSRLCWFGHVEQSNSWIKRCTTLEVAGKRDRGRPRMTWVETIKNDKKEWKLSDINPTSHVEWRKALRIKMGNVQPSLSG